MNLENPKKKRKNQKHPISHGLQYAVLRLMTFGFRLFPRSTTRFLGSWLGRIAYSFLPGRRRIALANLDLAFGNDLSKEEKQRIVKQVFFNFGYWFLDLLFYTKDTEEKVRSRIYLSPETQRVVTRFMGQDQGVLFLISHFGHWELMGLYLGIHFEHKKTAVVVKAMHNPYVDRWINEIRSITGNEIIYAREASIKILRALRQKTSIAIVYDQDSSLSRGGIYTTFFGEGCVTNRAVATYSLARDVLIISAYCIPLDDGRFEVRIEPIIDFERTGDRETDIQNLTQHCNNKVEKYIRQYPEYYFWIHKRWKHRPPGCPPVYENER